MNNKSRNSLILLITTAILVITNAILILVFINEGFAIFLLIPLFVLLFFTAKINRYFKFALMDHKYQLLQNGKAGPVSCNLNVLSKAWEKSLVDTYNYQSFLSHENYIILYKFIKGPASKRKDNTLVALVVIRDEGVKFESVALAKDLSNLEKSVAKIQKYKHRIILQFKNGDLTNKKQISSVDKVFYFQQTGINFVLINILHDPKQKQLYYLHNNNYYPTTYYKYGLEELERLI